MRAKWLQIVALLCVVLLLAPLPAHPAAAEVQAQAGAAFKTDDDNENNARTGSADGDIYSANSACLFNTNPVTPIEFNIVAPTLPSFSTAQLSLYAFDVDEQGAPGYQPEVDEVFFNGQLVGSLTGWNDTWSTTVFSLDPAWVRQGNNLVEVRINKHYPNDDQTWCTSIDWGQLVLDRGGGAAFIRDASLDRECFIPGQDLAVFVEVDTTAASQEVKVEINILDPTGVTQGSTSRTFVTSDAASDSFIETVTVPADAPSGTYTVQAIVYDTATMLQQDIWTETFRVDPVCGTVTAVVSDTPTAWPTDTPTAWPTNTPTAWPTNTPTAWPTITPTVRPTDTPTVRPPDTPTATPTSRPGGPACAVTCNKTVSPSTVGPGDEVVVTISLTGSNGTCKVTSQNADVMLVIDKSGSMGDDTASGGPQQPMTDSKNAASSFVDRMDLTRDQVGMVPFDSGAGTPHQLSNNGASVKSAIAGLTAGGGTDIAAGIGAAQAELTSGRHKTGNAPVIVLLSDGQSDEAAARKAADAAKAAGTRIFTIGLGKAVKPAVLQALATSPGDYYQAATSAELAAIYGRIAGAIQGVPGTNVVITDVLGPGMTLVPNSFTGGQAPTVNGSTLVWQAGSLGFETRSWTYKVKAPQMAGTYPVNASAEVTYIDSNGQPAKTSCPSPQITVIAALPACTVTCLKTASPDRVAPGEEVVVTISVTGSDGACRKGAKSADVILVIDKSGSMHDDAASGGLEQPITDARNAASAFVDLLDLTRDQVGLVPFDHVVGTPQQLSGNGGAVKSAIAALGASGGTDLAAAIRAAQAELTSARRKADNAPVIVLLSDGHSDEAAARSAADAAKAAGTRIFIIGLGSAVKPAFLQSLASAAGDYFPAATGAELAAIYNRIAGGIQGLAATSLTITDVLGPDVTLVSNSFGGAPAPTVNGKTLVWQVPALGFETKSWTYRVKAPQALGTYPVNASAEVTYIDSNGSPGRTDCQDPQIVVVAGPITRTPTPTATPTPIGYVTPTPTATPTSTPTPRPPAPACSVTCDKKAVPGSVNGGDEVTVILSLTGSDGACRVTHSNADVIMVIDKSGSMSDDSSTPQQPMTDAKSAAMEFVDRMDLSKDQVGVVSFADVAEKRHELSAAAGSVRAAIDGLNASGGTNIAAGISVAQAELTSARHKTANAPVIVLLSDGQSNEGDARTAANAAKAAGTRIFTIGLGKGVNPAELQALASAPGDYYAAATRADLAAIYARIAGAIQGQPGTNLTITDVLGPDVTLVPNSFTGSPAPTVNGKTLTWSLSSLGFETKTWTYKVKAPQKAGDFPVNTSADVTYTDSNGKPARTGCPGPLITVLQQNESKAEIYTKDNDADSGAVPSSEPWWESPDIWVRQQADGQQQHQNPQVGQLNYIHVRVRNIGSVTVTNITVHIYGAKAMAAFQWPLDWVPEIGSATIASLPAGKTFTVSIPWRPPLAGHFCFLSRIEAAQDPITHDGWVKFDNNISQKNVHVMDLQQAPLDSSVILVNPSEQPSYVDLQVGGTGMGTGSLVSLQFDDPELFQRWQAAGGAVTGGQIVPESSTIELQLAGGLEAVIGRVPLDAGESAAMSLQVSGPAEGQPIVWIKQLIDGVEVGGNIYRPSMAAGLGDGNGDGLCTKEDALMALLMASGTLLSNPQLDVNQDGVVSEVDAMTILDWATAGGTCGG